MSKKKDFLFGKKPEKKITFIIADVKVLRKKKEKKPHNVLSFLYIK